MKKSLFGSGILALVALTLGGATALACDRGGCYDHEQVYAELLRFSQSSRCPTLSSLQALQLARMASDGQLDPQGFMQAYDATCNLYDSTTAAANGYRAKLFTEVFKASGASRCPTLSTLNALNVAIMGSERRLFADEFSRNYDASCNYNDALSAASSTKSSEIYRDVLNFSKQSRCPTLSSLQVLRLAQAASEGREDARDFKMAYNTSCNYEDAFAAARCDRLGMYKGATSPGQELASALEVSEGGKTNLGEFDVNATPAPIAAKGSVNVID